MVDRIRRPSEYDAMLTEFKDKKIFATYKDTLLFAACLGFNRKRRVSFSNTSEPINLQIFSDEFNKSVINILAVAESSDLLFIGKENEDERIKIFEEYACGGLEIIKNELWDAKLPLDKGLTALIMQEEGSDKFIGDITGLSMGGT